MHIFCNWLHVAAPVCLLHQRLADAAAGSHPPRAALRSALVVSVGVLGASSPSGGFSFSHEKGFALRWSWGGGEGDVFFVGCFFSGLFLASSGLT